jgi:hypothetical protein
VPETPPETPLETPPPAGGGTPPPVAADTTPPVVRLSAKRSALKLGTVVRRGLVITVRCNEPCSSKAELTLSKALARKLGLTRRPFVGEGKGTTKLVIRLDVQSKRVFARLRRVIVTLRVVTTDAAGNRTRTNRRLRLRR